MEETKTKKDAAPDFALLREGSRYALADLRDPMGAVEFADEEESFGAPEETIVLPCGAKLAVYAGKVGSAETCGYRQALEACDRASRRGFPESRRCDRGKLRVSQVCLEKKNYLCAVN